MKMRPHGKRLMLRMVYICNGGVIAVMLTVGLIYGDPFPKPALYVIGIWGLGWLFALWFVIRREQRIARESNTDPHT